MSPRIRALVIWGPRLLGVALCGFLALFALDAFDGRPILQVLPGFAIHLIPAALVGIAVAIAWRFPWVGAALFTGLAVAYAVSVPARLNWILVISGPLLLTGVLFALGATFAKHRPPQHGAAR
jgi:hypothetical protein